MKHGWMKGMALGLIFGMMPVVAEQRADMEMTVWQQEDIFANIASKYRLGIRDTQGVKQLENMIGKLSKSAETLEEKRLLEFLSLCVRDMSQILESPPSRENELLLGDLSMLAREGIHQLASLEQNRSHKISAR